MLVKRKSFLIRHPFIGSLVLMILFGIFLFGSSISAILLFGSLAFIIYLVLLFIFVFGANMLLFLIITPYGLHIPNGKEEFNEYTRTIGLRNIEPLKRNLFLGILTFIIIASCGWLFIVLFGTYVFNPSAVFGVPEPGNSGFFIFIYALQPGIWEEVAFRGIIFTLLTKKYTEKKSILISSFLFGLMHLFNLINGAGLFSTIFQVLYATIFGILFAYMFSKTKSLLPCIICHYLIDSLGQLFSSGFVSGLFANIIVTIIGFAIIPLIINLILIRSITKEKDNK
jgi:membrane protease YdiL (CAAX protease family)